jgi:hypothetical protein
MTGKSSPLKGLISIFQQNVLRDLRLIKVLSFASNGKALLYSGVRIDDLTNTVIFSNWVSAAEYAKVHDMIPVELTKGGHVLSHPDRFKEYKKRYGTDEVAILLWKLASQQYVRQIEGCIRTLVCCSQHNSTFRTVELPELLNSTKIDDINGKPRTYFAAHFKRAAALLESKEFSNEQAKEYALDSTYRLIVKQELSLDFARAAAKGDTNLEIATKLRAQEMVKFIAEEKHLKATTDYKSKAHKNAALLSDALARNPKLLQQLASYNGRLPRHYSRLTI